MSTELRWKTVTGEWRFYATGAEELSTGGVACVRAPSGDFIFSARITPRRGPDANWRAGLFFCCDADMSNGYTLTSPYPRNFWLEKLENGERRVIAGGRAPITETFTLTVIVAEGRILCFADGRKVAEVAERAPLQGEYAGLITLETTAVYEGISLEAIEEGDLEKHMLAMLRQDIAQRERLYGLRCHVIDMKDRGGFHNIGDLDGDGKMDFLVTRGTHRMTAVTQQGEVLWQMDNPGGKVHAHPECQMPVTIYDIDADGANEVICRWYHDGREMLYILDGRTGAIKRERQWVPIPDPTGTVYDYGKGWMTHMMIANLRGRDLPQDILIAAGHVNLFAFDDQLEPLWNITLDRFFQEKLPWLGHHPYVEDIDGDGRDEVATGGMLIDHDGGIIWAKDLRAELNDDHIDSVMIGDVDEDPSNGKEIAFSTGACLLNAKGEYNWQNRELVVHGQCVRLGKVRADVPGLQMLVLDCDGGSPGTYLFSATGKLLLKLPPGLIALVDWNGDGLDEIACGTNIYDGYGRVLAELPWAEVHSAHGCSHGAHQHFLSVDVMGDAREELVWASGDLIIIFENAAPNPNPPLRLTLEQQRARWKKVYNYTRY